MATTVDAASAVGPFGTVILGFISGVFIPVKELPTWLVDIGQRVPLGAPGRRLAAIVHSRRFIGDQRDEPRRARGVGEYGALVVAIRTFKWEPLGAQS